MVDAEKARIVSKIFADFLNNKDINMICDNLNSSEIRTSKGNRWDCRAIEYILQNPVYIGKSGGIQSAKRAEISITKI